jgi:hypothetical protein
MMRLLTHSCARRIDEITFETRSKPILLKGVSGYCKIYWGLMLVDKTSSGVILEFLLKETKHTRGRSNDKRLQRFLYMDVRCDR